jgi:hypothetical protein
MEFQENNNFDVIHYKVSYEEQIRRFSLQGTEFTSLRATIAKLYSLDAEFVLKYKDDESDYVTLYNQQDLTTAIMISPSLLRVLVQTTSPSQPEPDQSRDCSKYGRRRYHHHHKSFDHRRQRVEKKLAWINLQLQDMSNDSSLSQRDQWRKQRLLKKKERIEYFLTGDFPCRERMTERTLSPEEKQFNCAAKLQIAELKGEMQKLKTRKREIKSLLNSSPLDQELQTQLTTVKEQKNLLRAQKRDLCDKMLK